MRYGKEITHTYKQTLPARTTVAYCLYQLPTKVQYIMYTANVPGKRINRMINGRSASILDKNLQQEVSSQYRG